MPQEQDAMSRAGHSVDEAVRELEERLTAFVRAECRKLKAELCGSEEEPGPDSSAITLADVAAGEFDALGSVCTYSEGAENVNGEAQALAALSPAEAPPRARAPESTAQDIPASTVAEHEENDASKTPAAGSHVSSPGLRLSPSAKRQSFPEFVLQRAPQWGRRTALIDDAEGGRVITYRTLLADIRIIAAALSACGCTVARTRRISARNTH